MTDQASSTDLLAHDVLADAVPSPYFDLDPTADPVADHDAARLDAGGLDTAGRGRAAVHTVAASGSPGWAAGSRPTTTSARRSASCRATRGRATSSTGCAASTPRRGS
jgi:hypothetical protein